MVQIIEFSQGKTLILISLLIFFCGYIIKLEKILLQYYSKCRTHKNLGLYVDMILWCGSYITKWK